MTTEHPITPPPDRIHNWLQLEKVGYTLGQIITLAAQWGADRELEACCKWTTGNFGELPGRNLHLFRRPKPQSLKEKALEAQQRMWDGGSTHEDWQLIRRAIEALPND
jgi:hypothetical protein